LGFPANVRLRPFSATGVLVLQVVIGCVNFTIGLLLLTFYIVRVGSAARAELTTDFAATLLPIALLSFVFGILSFAASILAVGNRPYSIPTYVQQQPEYARAPAMMPEVVSREAWDQQYVTRVRQRVLERSMSWTEGYCPQCGSDVPDDARYCDRCGSPLGPRPSPTLSAGY
jgi:hypothetical protein